MQPVHIGLEVIPIEKWEGIIQYLDLKTLFQVSLLSKDHAAEVARHFSSGIAIESFANHLSVPCIDTGRFLLCENEKSTPLIQNPKEQLQWALKQKSKIEGDEGWIAVLMRKGLNYKTVVRYIQVNYPEVGLEGGSYQLDGKQPSLEASYVMLFSRQVIKGTLHKHPWDQHQAVFDNGCLMPNRLEFVASSFCLELQGLKIYNKYETRLWNSDRSSSQFLCWKTNHCFARPCYALEESAKNSDPLKVGAEMLSHFENPGSPIYNRYHWNCSEEVGGNEQGRMAVKHCGNVGWGYVGSGGVRRLALKQEPLGEQKSCAENPIDGESGGDLC